MVAPERDKGCLSMFPSRRVDLRSWLGAAVVNLDGQLVGVLSDPGRDLTVAVPVDQISSGLVGK